MGNEATGSSHRRPPRPTVRFLRLLPPDSFPESAQAEAIARAGWSESLVIGGIRHPLIEDAQKRFADGLPDRHKGASQSAGRPVYEVRSRTGAAWRGAIILDDAGDPWLIWADKHDSFHNGVAKIVKGLESWLPRPVEYKLRTREEAAAAHGQWRRDAAAVLLAGVAAAVETPNQESVVELAEFEGGQRSAISIALDHDLPSGHPESDRSLLTVLIRMGSETSDDFIRFVLPALQPDPSLIDSTYTRDSKLETWVTITQAQLAQIVASQGLGTSDSETDYVCLPLTHLHYVGQSGLADAMILGVGSRAICGQWFVPTRDRHAELPVCPACEEIRPAAQQTVDLIRAALGSQG